MIKRVKRASGKSVTPKRAYYCNDCKTWHLTHFKNFYGKSNRRGNKYLKLN